MSISEPKKRCGLCSKQMQRWGTTLSGKPRWRCGSCKKSSIRKRKDNREMSRLFLFIKWLTTKTSLEEIALFKKISVRTLLRWFEPFWLIPPQPQITTDARVLVLDGTSVVKRKLMLLIAGDGDQHIPIFWSDVHRECFDTWGTFLCYLLMCHVQPEYIVCDGQKGLLKAIREVYPNAKIQRCVIHIIRQSNRWLTKNPKKRAGRELLVLVKQLPQIQTKRQKRRWIRSFKYWCKRHDKFLKERSYGPTGRWWYTHRRLRGTRSLIKNAIPDLFRHVSDPTVPKTSNHVEGGLNARLKELFRCHRGLSPQKKLVLAAWYLALRQGQKPTQNVH